MFKEHITPIRTANAIIQDTSSSYFLLVEGEKDIPIYKKLMSAEIQIKVSFGKSKMREIDSILKDRDFKKYLGIRDADFLRLNGNPKYISDYNGELFATDEHDSEGMIISSEALTDFIDTISSADKAKLFEAKHGSIRDLCYNLCYPLACLRLSNKINNHGLAFKPQKPEGNKLKYKKFICEDNFCYLGHDKMINTVLEYSTNRGGVVASRQIILSHLEAALSENHNLHDIVNGHDLSEALYLICKKGLKSQNKLLIDAKAVEDMLRLAYNLEHFKKTTIFNDLCNYQKTINSVILR